jgi:GPI-anchor transamidase subunit U
MRYKLSDGLPLMFPLCLLALMGISTLIAGNFRWIKETWGATYVYYSVRSGFVVDFVLGSLTVPDLTPNVGLWWYFFTEMFDHFRSFFLMVFTAMVVIGTIPITIKFQ